MIRIAKPADAAGMLAIYAPYIRDTSFTFEADVPSPQAFADRIASYLANWPWLVWEAEDGRIAGYAYASRYRERVGYQWCVECSVYIHDDFHRRGIAQSLYRALFRVLKAQGYYNLYAVINLPNDRSVRLHEACGFTWFANYEQVGYKLGKWKTVGWWRLMLQEAYIDNPLPPLRLADMEARTLEGLLREPG
jgi:phosphinothricin acetyltransferase